MGEGEGEEGVMVWVEEKGDVGEKYGCRIGMEGKGKQDSVWCMVEVMVWMRGRYVMIGIVREIEKCECDGMR